MQRTLLSSNPLANVLLALFVIGALLFVIGALLRRGRATHAIEAPSREPQEQTEPSLDVAGRFDLVERLVMVGEPWCIDQLGTLRRDDPDESVREAADAALMVIAARAHVT